jgi:phytoene dehydrogenase-like protein
MNSTIKQTDAIVIGGGLAGLTTAAYLARNRRGVELFERSATLGGRGDTRDREGFLFNKGPHAVYEKSLAAEVLHDLGVTFTYGSPANVKALYRGEIQPFPDSPRKLFGSRLFDFGAKLEASKVMFALQKAKPAELAHITVNEWLDDNVKDPTLRALLEASIRVAAYSDAPDQLSMQVAAEQIQQVLGGKIYYVNGGWQVLVDGIAAKAREAGATLHTGVRVEHVTRSGDTWEVHLGDGTVRRAHSVVLAVEPQDAARLVEGEGADTLESWASQAVPVKAATLDVALRRLPRPENAVTIKMDGPLFLTTQSQFSRLAPEGKALVYSIKYLPPGIPTDPEADRRDLEALFDKAQPGWRDEEIERQFMPHLTVYNKLATAQASGLAGRPGPAVLGAPGLYVAGDWVGPRGLLASASMWSARQAARAIVAGEREAREAVAA